MNDSEDLDDIVEQTTMRVERTTASGAKRGSPGSRVFSSKKQPRWKNQLRGLRAKATRRKR